MFRTLNKLSGALVGAVMYPIKSLIINTLLTLAVSALAVISLIVSPIILAFSVLINILQLKLLKVFYALVAILLIILVTVSLVVELITLTIKDFFNNIKFGISDGYENGLFFHVIYRTWSDHLIFTCVPFHLLDLINSSLGRAREPSKQTGFTPGELALLQINEEEELDYSNSKDITQKCYTKIKFAPLSADELHLAESVVELQEALTCYNSFYQAFLKLKTAVDEREEKHGQLSNNLELNDIEDEFITNTSVKKPALLVKQYEIDNKWKTIPHLIKIIDEQSLLDWLEKKKTHTTTRENMLKPNPYKPDPKKEAEFPTRYKIIPYENILKLIELVKATITIRDVLQKRNRENLPKVGEVLSSVVDTLGQRFFAREDRHNGITSEETPAVESRKNDPSSCTM